MRLWPILLALALLAALAAWVSRASRDSPPSWPVGLQADLPFDPLRTPNGRATRAPVDERPSPPPLAGPDPFDGLMERWGNEEEAGWWYEPLPWNPAVSDHVGPEGFAATMQRVLADCPDGYRFMGADCAEAPCYAFIGRSGSRLSWSGSSDCGVWREAYGAAAMASLALAVPCAQGEVWLMAISPSTAVTDSLPPELADDYQLAMDRKVPRLRAVLTPERLAELCAQFYASEGGSP